MNRLLELDPERPPPLADPCRIADGKTFRTARAELVRLGGALGLIRLTPRARAALGVTNSSFQFKRSMAALRLLRKRPDLAARLKQTSLAAWQQLCDLRLAIGQARTALRPLLRALRNGERLLLGALTEKNDRVEDYVLARIADEDTTPTERRVLRGLFSGAPRLRALISESAAARKARRARRSARAEERLGRARQSARRLRGAAALRTAELPEKD